MRDPVRLTPADARRVPWRNGRGVTEEILVRPDGASFERGDFDLRISKAGVTGPGPFSSFPGFDRVLVVTSGAGLVLSHGDAAPPARVAPLEPYAFSGDRPTAADLVGGPVADFNVIVRRGRLAAGVRVVRPGSRSETLLAGNGDACDLFVHVVSGQVIAAVRGGDGARAVPGALSPGESVWVRDVAPGGETLSLRTSGRNAPLPAGAADPDPAVVLVVRIAPA